MAFDKITEYSATNASNTAIGDVNVQEGMLPSAVNNAIREQMTHLKESLGSGTPLYVDQTNNRLGVNNAAPATALDVTGVITTDGMTTSGDITFGDNDKATFGDAVNGDLRIYHDASNSYIQDAGTGSLFVQATNLILKSNDTGENYMRGIQNGVVELFHNGIKKIETTATGCTITGTAIATTDTDTTNTGSVTLDFGANQNFVLTLTGNVTLANPSTEQVGQSGFITFIQDATGGRTVSLGTDYETAGAAGITLSSTASTTDIVPYVVVASGRILLGAPQLAFA